jgi:hypothetical protein
MTSCRGCGGQVSRRSRVYCSNTCQQELQRRQRVELWLATGRCVADTHQGHYVRDHLHAEQQGVCAVCQIPDVWAEAPLTFVLDHVNGDSADNRRENLRLVCPNCDSQLPTYKARNKGRGRAWRRTLVAGGPPH